MLLIFSNIYSCIFHLFLSKCKLVLPPLKAAEVCFEAAEFLRPDSTRAESRPYFASRL